MTFDEFIIDTYKLVLEYFVRWDKRIHWLYWLTSIALAFWVYSRSGKTKSFFIYFFRKENYLSKSALIDYLFLFFNAGVKVLLAVQLTIWGKELHIELKELFMREFGLVLQPYSISTLLILYPIALIIIGDFTYYLLHLLYHKIPFFWEFHKVHHSSTALNPITQYRIHPVELVLNNFRYILVLTLLNSLFDYLSVGYFKPWHFQGASLALLLFNSFGANLRHSHVKLTYFPWLERILISPFQHQIHHSSQKELFDKNLGSKLAIWDWLFGTLVRSKDVEKLEVGLGEENSEYDSFLKNLFLPFKKAVLTWFRK